MHCYKGSQTLKLGHVRQWVINESVYTVGGCCNLPLPLLTTSTPLLDLCSIMQRLCVLHIADWVKASLKGGAHKHEIHLS